MDVKLTCHLFCVFYAISFYICMVIKRALLNVDVDGVVFRFRKAGRTCCLIAVLYNFTECRCSSAWNTVQQQPCSLEEGEQSQLVIETGLNYYSYHLLFLLLGSIWRSVLITSKTHGCCCALFSLKDGG